MMVLGKFQFQGILLLVVCKIVEKGPTVLAVGAVGVVLIFFSHLSFFFFLPPPGR